MGYAGKGGSILLRLLVVFVAVSRVNANTTDAATTAAPGTVGSNVTSGAVGTTVPTVANGTVGTAGSNVTSGAVGTTVPTVANGTVGTAGSNVTSGAVGTTVPTVANGTVGTAGDNATSAAMGTTVPTVANGTVGTAGDNATSAAMGTTVPTVANGTVGTAGDNVTSAAMGTTVPTVANGTVGTAGANVTSAAVGTTVPTVTSGTAGAMGTTVASETTMAVTTASPFSGCSSAADCNNQGTCNNGTCVCDYRYTGADCSAAYMCSNDSECNNGGACTSGSCNCTSGFSGRNCDIAIVSAETVITDDPNVKAVVEVVIAAVFHPELENTSSQFFKDYVARLAPQLLEIFRRSLEKQGVAAVDVKIRIVALKPGSVSADVAVETPNDLDPGSANSLAQDLNTELVGTNLTVPNPDGTNSTASVAGAAVTTVNNGTANTVDAATAAANPWMCASPSDCSNHGICSGGNCSCGVGYTGVSCANQVTVTCTNSSDCQNGGTCSASSCACATGYAGATCTISAPVASSFLNGNTSAVCSITMATAVFVPALYDGSGCESTFANSVKSQVKAKVSTLTIGTVGCRPGSVIADLSLSGSDTSASGLSSLASTLSTALNGQSLTLTYPDGSTDTVPVSGVSLTAKDVDGKPVTLDVTQVASDQCYVYTALGTCQNGGSCTVGSSGPECSCTGLNYGDTCSSNQTGVVAAVCGVIGFLFLALVAFLAVRRQKNTAKRTPRRRSRAGSRVGRGHSKVDPRDKYLYPPTSQRAYAHLHEPHGRYATSPQRGQRPHSHSQASHYGPSQAGSYAYAVWPPYGYATQSYKGSDMGQRSAYTHASDKVYPAGRHGYYGYY